MNKLDLDCASPDDVPVILERIAAHYRDSSTELSSAWQDESAGKVWQDFASILERAAIGCRKAIRNRLG
jgi:hypothetical protein